MLTDLTQINFGLVFLEGLLSFFSPCVLPLLPVYLSYLAGENGQTMQDGTKVWKRSVVFTHTACFVLGISAAFFLLGFSFSALGQFLGEHKMIIQRVGGLIIFLFGLAQLGLFSIPALQRERRMQYKGPTKLMNPVSAFVLGFTFSFAWTPCVGPALSSVLLMASGEGNMVQGTLLILLYTLGFVLPFLLVGLFTSEVLRFIQKRKNIMRYAQKIGGALLAVIGLVMLLGISIPTPGAGNGAATPPAQSQSQSQSAPEGSIPSIYEFTMEDQYRKVHSLEDYRGKIVLLNFWTTWCGYCKKEMPELQELYEEYGKNSGDIVILGVAAPKSDQAPQNPDHSKNAVLNFLSQEGYTFPILFDETGLVLESYQVSGFPTNYIIGRDGQPLAGIPGAVPKEKLKELLEKAREM